MRQLEALRALAKLAADNETDNASVLAEAARITGSAIGSGDVRLFAGDGVHFQAYPQREDEDFFGMTPEGSMARSNAARKANVPIVFSVGADREPQGFAPADGQAGGSHLTMALWRADALAGSIVADGPWTPKKAQRGGGFLESAAPALSLMLDRVIDADRTKRIEAQMSALSSVASVFVEAKNMQDALQDVANAINSATGFLCSVDVMDARGQIVTRSAGVSRYKDTPLHQAWLNMIEAPDRVKDQILKDREPLLLPDLQHDQRLSAEAREFYTKISLVSGATFPLLIHDQIIGLLRVGSLKPTTFPDTTVDLLQKLSVQVAMVVNGFQLYEERKALEDQLRHQAFHDPLTDLANRARFTDRLEQALLRSERSGQSLAVLFMDVDSFKTINDNLGHSVGDQLLIEISARLLGCLRKSATCARLGGDEFAILLEDLHSVEDATRVASRITKALAAPFTHGGQNLVVSASIGIAMSDGGAASSDGLLRKADLAMYSAKGHGKARFEIYEPSMRSPLLSA